MQAAVLDKFITSHDEITLRSVDIPSPPPGFAVVRVIAAGINPVEKLIAAGYVTASGWVVPFPYIPGEDFSGVVHSVGEGVDNIQVGDEVFACNWGAGRHDELVENPVVGGAFAEYALIRASKVSKKPQGVSFEEAAAIGIPGITAYEALFKIGQLSEGQEVLILGGSSAVGIFAIQFAKIRGAKVYTTCSDRTESFVKSLGADVVINYTTSKWEEAVHDVDVIFDCVGEKDGLKRALAHSVAKAGGKFITIADFSVGFDSTAYPPFSWASAMCLSQDTTVQDQIAKWIADGEVRVTIDERFPFTQEGIVALYDKVASGKSTGKNILNVSS